MVLASTWMERVANSTPMVDFESRLNSLRVNLLSRLDLPTPESPISTTVRGNRHQHSLSPRRCWVKSKVFCSRTFEEELHT